VLQSYAMTAVAMGAGFLLIPNLSAYVQGNLGFPRSSLWKLYGAGGVLSFITLRLVGKLVDRFGSFRVGTTGSLLMLLAIWLIFIDVPINPPVLLLFLFFLFALSVRNVAYSTLTSKVPKPAERARFMSFQSAVQHLASAAGAIVSSFVLAQGSGGRLLHMPRLGALSLLLVATFPVWLWLVERAVDRDASAPLPPTLETHAELGPRPDGMARPLKKV